ncbi:MAG: pseudouridine synthase [Verrucomicrobiota bacterium]
MLISFYKPYRVLSQFSEDGSENRTLRDFQLPDTVHPIGRLDADTEGLLLLTDEPGWEDRLLHPAKRHPKVYWAQVEGKVEDSDLKQLRQGLKTKRTAYLPAKATVIQEPGQLPDRNPPIRFRKSVPATWLEIMIKEGKNRQVRKMTASIGYPTLRLIRASIGHYSLGSLQPGKWVELSDSDRASLCQPTSPASSCH